MRQRENISWMYIKNHFKNPRNKFFTKIIAILYSFWRFSISFANIKSANFWIICRLKIIYRFDLITVLSPFPDSLDTKSQAILPWHLHLYDNFLSSLVEKNSFIFVSLTITQSLPNFRLDSYNYPTQTMKPSVHLYGNLLQWEKQRDWVNSLCPPISG